MLLAVGLVKKRVAGSGGGAGGGDVFGEGGEGVAGAAGGFVERHSVGFADAHAVGVAECVEVRREIDELPALFGVERDLASEERVGDAAAAVFLAIGDDDDQNFPGSLVFCGGFDCFFEFVKSDAHRVV